MTLEETLNVIAQLQATRTNIHRLYVQEWIGYGKFKRVLEGKTLGDLKSLSEYNKFKDYVVVETDFLPSGCYITVVRI